MAINVINKVISEKYTKESLVGLGALKGAPCTIKSKEPVDGGTKIVFEWTGTDGIQQTSEVILPNGKNGKDGIDGTDGITPTVEITSDGYWKINGIKTSVKASATNGKDGTNGVDGKTPNFTIGTVTTLPSGSNATVTLTGTQENPILNIGIPKGEKGDPGQDGQGGSGSSESTDSYLPYSKGLYDTNPIPDIRNTGCRGDLVPFNEHPAFLGASVPENGLLYLTPTHIANNGSNVFENIDFTGFTVYISKNATQYGTDTIKFKNCNFNARVNGAFKMSYCIQFVSGDVHIECDYCTFKGAKACVANGTKNIFDHCYATDMAADCWKIGEDCRITNSYAAIGGQAVGAHADGIQFSQGKNFYVENYRCDAIAIKDFNVYNAGLYVDFELGDDKVLDWGVAKNIYLNGGGYTFYTVNATGYTLKDIEIENYQYGCSYQYGGVGCSNPNYTWFNENTTKPTDTVYVTSVWKENGKIKFLVTNYTNQERKLIIKTTKGNTEFTIPKCPKFSEYYDTYTSVEQFPFNLEYEVDDASWFVAYDTAEIDSNQIRFVNFGGSSGSSVSKEEIKEIVTEILQESGCSTGGLDVHVDGTTLVFSKPESGNEVEY